MTIGDLRKIINEIDERYDNSEIEYYYENEGCGKKVFYAWFDLSFSLGEEPHFNLTLCNTLEDYNNHEGRTSWNGINNIFYKESNILYADKTFTFKVIDNLSDLEDLREKYTVYLNKLNHSFPKYFYTFTSSEQTMHGKEYTEIKKETILDYINNIKN